jgi:hypothetical protein
MATTPSNSSPGAAGTNSPSPQLAGLEDKTEYKFGSPATNRKVLLKYSASIVDAGKFSQFVEDTRQNIEEYFHAKLLSRQTGSIPSGNFVTLVFDMRPEPGQIDEPRQWVGIVHFSLGDTVTLSYQARKDDNAAEAEYQRLLKSVRKNSAGPQSFAALRHLMTTPKTASPTSFPVNAVTIDLTGDYLRPTTFHFATPNRESVTLKLAGDRVEVAQPVEPGAIATHLDELGMPVRVRKSRPLWNSRPSAKGKAKVELAAASSMARSSTVASIQLDGASGRPVNLQVAVRNAQSNASEWAKAIQEELEKPK